MNIILTENSTLKSWQIGIDEVGRGPVAGPVCVGLCVLPIKTGIYTYKHIQNNLKSNNLNVSALSLFNNSRFTLDSFGTFWHKLRDSKKTTAKFRQQVFERAGEVSRLFIVLKASSNLIDEYGIAVCIRHLLYLGLIIFSEINPEFKSSILFLDGTLKLQQSYNQKLLKCIFEENFEENFADNFADNFAENFAENLEENHNQTQNLKLESQSLQNIKNTLENLNLFNASNLWDSWNLEIIEENFADDKFLSVALASNLAKHFRDEIMLKYSQKFPNYFLETNMGYGTAKHIQAIKENGLSPIHRQTFLKKYLE